MASYTTNIIRSGNKVIVDNEPYVVISNEMIKPGKGQAFNRIKMRNLKNQRVIEKTLKSGDSLEVADLVELEAQYLYYDGDQWHFMNLKTFEQYAITTDIVGETKLWLKENDTCQLTLWNNYPLSVVASNFVVMEVIDTEPGIKGDTVSGANKPATLSSGAVVRVPLFVQQGEYIKVDTRTGEYISRVKI